MSNSRQVRLFRNGRNQALRIPVEWELPGETATIRRSGDRLIIEPSKKKPTLVEVLATLSPIDERMPDLHEDLLPLRDIDL